MAMSSFAKTAMNTYQETPRKEISQAGGEPILILDKITKHFGEQKVLQGITLTLKPGEVVALLGSNGSGKSTLLRTVPRLLEPDSGTINVLGKAMSQTKGRALRAIRSQVGFVFQKHNLVPRLSALTNTLHGALGRTRGPQAWFHSLAPRALREEALWCLTQVGLQDHALKQTRLLSGGQSQRVAIARALMQQPKLILADEPVASLDPDAGEQVMELLQKVAKELGIGLLFSTHHLQHAIHYADRIIGLIDGKIRFDARANDMDIPTLRSIYES